MKKYKNEIKFDLNFFLTVQCMNRDLHETFYGKDGL